MIPQERWKTVWCDSVPHLKIKATSLFSEEIYSERLNVSLGVNFVHIRPPHKHMVSSGGCGHGETEGRERLEPLIVNESVTFLCAWKGSRRVSSWSVVINKQVLSKAVQRHAAKWSERLQSSGSQTHYINKRSSEPRRVNLQSLKDNIQSHTLWKCPILKWQLSQTWNVYSCMFLANSKS